MNPAIDLHPMNWNQAIDHNPVLCFALIAGCCFVSWQTISGTLCLFRRFCRVLMVVARGWPPAHLDGDGNVNCLSDRSCTQTSSTE